MAAGYQGRKTASGWTAAFEGDVVVSCRAVEGLGMDYAIFKCPVWEMEPVRFGSTHEAASLEELVGDEDIMPHGLAGSRPAFVMEGGLDFSHGFEPALAEAAASGSVCHRALEQGRERLGTIRRFVINRGPARRRP